MSSSGITAANPNNKAWRKRWLALPRITPCNRSGCSDNTTRNAIQMVPAQRKPFRLTPEGR